MTIMFSIQSAPILLFLFVAYLATLLYLAVYQGRKLSVLRYALLTAFVIYLLAVLHLVLFPIDVNISPSGSQGPWYIGLNLRPRLIFTSHPHNFLLSIILLVPFGVFLPLLSGKFASIRTIAWQSFLFSLTIELMQLLMTVTLGSGRITDVNDLIANTLGGVLGFLLLKQVSRIVPIDQFFHRDARPTR